jgi:hypothetical protein
MRVNAAQKDVYRLPLDTIAIDVDPHGRHVTLSVWLRYDKIEIVPIGIR